MVKIHYICNHLFNFIIGFFIFSFIFIFIEFLFYKIIGVTLSIIYICISNIKLLLLIYLLLYILIYAMFHLYDIYYIKKINRILFEIKGGKFNNEKNNKLKILVFLIILTIIAIALAIFIPFYNSKEFNDYGKQELIQYLNNITDEQTKKEEIDSAIEKGWITEEDLK